MPDLILPPYLRTAKIEVRNLDATGVSRGVFGGPPRTGTLGGDRLRANLEFSPTATTSVQAALERRTLVGLLARLQGKQNRLYMTSAARRSGGSLSAVELGPNPTMANGTTGYATGSFSLSVNDRVLRAMRVENVASVTSVARLSANAIVTQYLPHVLRVMVIAGRGTFTDLSLRAGSTDNGTEYAQSANTLTPGLQTLAFTPIATTVRAGLYQQNNTTAVRSDYLEVPYFSISQALLADNGPNALLQSQDLFTTWTQTNLSAPTANNTDVAPDGATTAETITENTANAEHYLEQSVTVSSAVADFTASCFFKQSSRTFAYLRVVEATAGTSVYVFVDLATGLVGQTGIGANWSNLRSAVVSYGNGWHRLVVTARKTNAATSIALRLGISNADGTLSYTGASLSIAAFGASLAQSSVPVRYVATTTTATTGVAQTGSGIHVKGLPASTNGILMPLDEVEIITSFGSEIKIVTASVNSDAAGLGYLQFSPLIRGVLSDSAPIVLHEPMGYYLFSGDAIGWEHMPGIITNASAEFEEAA